MDWKVFEMPMPQASRDPNRIQSVGRAIAVLEVLAEERSGLGIVEISERAQLPVSSVHRLLSTLSESGFVAQYLATGRYHVGVRAFEVGNAFLRQVQLGEIAKPHIHELVTLTRETANLALFDDDCAIYVDQVHSTRTLQVVPRPGARVPLHCSAVGKVFLAGMPNRQLEQTLDRLNLLSWTIHTITSTKTLMENVLQVRTKGYAVDDEEMQLGVRCIASPIYNHAGETAAALSLTGPAIDMNDERIRSLAVHLCRIASVISEQLGYQNERMRAKT
jgi:IclR family transcriptional regulator, KDG regulon repressor